MNIFFLALYIFILASSGFIAIYKLFLYYYMNKYFKKRIFLSSDEEKSKIILNMSRVLPLYRILFFFTPICLVLIPILLFIYTPESFMYITTTTILMYLATLEDYLYRKSLIKEIDKSKA